MAGVNKVIIVGNLGNDPEIRYLENGTCICNLSIATSESWKDKNTGEAKEKTEWHRCVAFNKPAEIMGEYLTKGAKVYLEGSLATRKWQDGEGNDKYTTEIKVRDFQFLDSKADREQGGGTNTRHVPPQQPKGGAQSGQAHGGKTAADFDDDIPF